MSLYFSKFFYAESHLMPIKIIDVFKGENMTPFLLQVEKQRQLERLGRGTESWLWIYERECDLVLNA